MEKNWDGASYSVKELNIPNHKMDQNVRHVNDFINVLTFHLFLVVMRTIYFYHICFITLACNQFCFILAVIWFCNLNASAKKRYRLITWKSVSDTKWWDARYKISDIIFNVVVIIGNFFDLFFAETFVYAENRVWVFCQ